VLEACVARQQPPTRGTRVTRKSPPKASVPRRPRVRGRRSANPIDDQSAHRGSGQPEPARASSAWPEAAIFPARRRARRAARASGASVVATPLRKRQIMVGRHEGRWRTGLLTADMKRVVEEQRLGFVATVCPDGTPNLSPIFESGALCDKAIAFYSERGSRVSAIREVVMVRVESAQPIDSPAYDVGLTEDEVRTRWERHYQSLRAGRILAPTGE
jgi:uncharacterized protein